MVSMATEWIGDFLPMLPQQNRQMNTMKATWPSTYVCTMRCDEKKIFQWKKEKNAHSGAAKNAVHTSGQNEIGYLK